MTRPVPIDTEKDSRPQISWHYVAKYAKGAAATETVAGILIAYGVINARG